MTNTQDTLEEYAHWTLGQTVKGWDTSPAEFMRQKRTARIFAGLSLLLSESHDDRYPIEEYLEEEDIEWIKSQGTTALAVVSPE